MRSGPLTSGLLSPFPSHASSDRFPTHARARATPAFGSRPRPFSLVGSLSLPLCSFLTFGAEQRCAIEGFGGCTELLEILSIVHGGQLLISDGWQGLELCSGRELLLLRTRLLICFLPVACSSHLLPLEMFPRSPAGSVVATVLVGAVREQDVFLSGSFPIKCLHVQRASEVVQMKFQVKTLALGPGSIQRIDFYLPGSEQTESWESSVHICA